MVTPRERGAFPDILEHAGFASPENLGPWPNLIDAERGADLRKFCGGFSDELTIFESDLKAYESGRLASQPDGSTMRVQLFDHRTQDMLHKPIGGGFHGHRIQSLSERFGLAAGQLGGGTESLGRLFSLRNIAQDDRENHLRAELQLGNRRRGGKLASIISTTEHPPPL